MASVYKVTVPLFERVVLEELAIRWDVSTEEAIERLIRTAAIAEALDRPKGEIRKAAAPELANG